MKSSPTYSKDTAVCVSLMTILI